MLKEKSNFLDKILYHENLLEVSIKLNKKEQINLCLDYLLRQLPRNQEYIKKFLNYSSLENAFDILNSKYQCHLDPIYSLQNSNDEESFKKSFKDVYLQYQNTFNPSLHK